MSIKVIRSETIYRGKVFSLRHDEIRLPEGHLARLDVVDHPASVTLVPVDDEGCVWFVRQYRHPAGEDLLELPAGTLDPGENPLACAVRECREEIGMSPGRLSPIGECFLAPGYTTEFMYFYLAEDLTPSPLAPDEDEDLHIVRLTRAQADDLVAGKSLRDAKTLLGLLLLGRQAKD
jgi:ADP-ribose pyrophosphatase